MFQSTMDYSLAFVIFEGGNFWWPLDCLLLITVDLSYR